MRVSIAARLGLCLLLIVARTVDAPALWDGLCRHGHSPHLTTGYLLWKHLGVEVDEHVRYAGLWHDGNLDRLVRGKDLAELQRLFPELKVGSPLTIEQFAYARSKWSYWKYAAPDPGAHRELYWLGDTTWMVELRNGLAVDLHYCKG